MLTIWMLRISLQFKIDINFTKLNPIKEPFSNLKINQYKFTLQE